MMPTDLPPDYKPQPRNNPANPADPNVPGSVPAYPPSQGDVARDPTGVPATWRGCRRSTRMGLPPLVPEEVPLPADAPTF